MHCRISRNMVKNVGRKFNKVMSVGRRFNGPKLSMIRTMINENSIETSDQ